MIKEYIRYRRAVFCFYLFAAAAVSLICFAYAAKAELTLYLLGVLTYGMLVFAFVDGMRFRRKCRRLTEICRSLTEYRPELPQASNQIEQLYGAIVEQFYQILLENTNTLKQVHFEQLEYYTRWLHQIKTPIAAIRLRLQGETHRDPVLEQELFKMEQYVEMALQYAKMGDFSSDLVIRDYPLRDIINSCVKKYSVLFIYKKLAVSITDPGVVVSTDSKWLAFIIEQLLSNAVKYTPRGTIRIFAAENTLTVADEGIGIRAEDTARIFEKGFTGYNGRQDRRASGIGLYMAKKAADRLSIRISADSQVGKGTRVTLRFPERKQESDL